MNMRTTTLENGMWAVVQDRPSAPGKAASSGFAAQLSRATQAAQADQAGGGELKAAYDRLSAASKAVLNRLSRAIGHLESIKAEGGGGQRL